MCVSRCFSRLCLVALIALVGASLGPSRGWHAYGHAPQGFTALAAQRLPARPVRTASCPHLPLPTTWDVRGAVHADLTGDEVPECALLVWRPWQDWPIMRWSEGTSPIADNRDARGESAHVILVEPSAGGGYREIWAGSALPAPILHLEVGDVDGDGQNELVTLEGDYETGREGPARHVAVWEWNGFGFTLGWRSPPVRLMALLLADADGDGTLDVWVRLRDACP